MIQFNLLPQVKLEFVKARRTKHITIAVASIVTALSLAVLIILFVSIQVFQKNNSRDLSRDIKTESKKLESIPDLNKILTIQNQLNSLSSLHENKPVATRFFDYIKQFTPANVSIADVSIDYQLQTVTITGSSDVISSVNTYVDTLKFTTYQADKDPAVKAFSEVVLTSFGKDDKGTSYTLTFKFDPLIFSNEKTVKLIVPPGKITTRSQTEKPKSLFQPLSNKEGQ